MLKRTITAVTLVTFILTMVFWVRQYWVGAADIVSGLFGLVGTYEMYKCLNSIKDEDGKQKYKVMTVPVVLGMILVAPFSIICAIDTGIMARVTPMDGLFMAILIPSLLALVIMTFRHEKYKLTDLFATVFTLVYPLSIMSLFFIMNNFRGGVLPIFLVMAIAVLEDTFAYLVGVTFKGPKLCPSISPKKTISGAIGGVLGGILGGVVTFLMFDKFDVFQAVANVGAHSINPDWRIALTIYIVVGFIGGVVGELGDLGASAIKRKLGIKDYGKIFPGHGGFMDRIDSFVFVLPIVYIMSCFVFPAQIVL